MAAAATTDLVHDTLGHVHGLVGGYMLDHLRRDQPSPWLWDLAADYPSRKGKALRPALCIATCCAFGGTEQAALPSAAAIELLHNAFLVHDDIEDESEQRRGRPTLHASEGVPLALNAGDAMILEAMSMLRANRDALSARLADQILDEFEAMLRLTVEGQATELGWRRDVVIDITPADYLDLVLRKTSWYTTIHPMVVGALIGSWRTVPLAPLIHFGTYLGAAFQIRDDILNLTSSEQRYGKEILGDLFEGKRTLMLIHLWQHVDADCRRSFLDPFLHRSRTERTASDVERVLALMHEHQSIEYASAFADGIAARAVTSFDEAFADAPASPHRSFVRALINFMLDRDH